MTKSKTSAKPKSQKKPKGAEVAEQAPTPVPSKEPESTSFADMAAGYLAALEEEGRSGSTINGYRRELVLAASVLEEETALAEITFEQVEAFLASDAVTKKRDGSVKSRLSTDRTSRVLRQALEWAADNGMVKAAPLPVEKD